MGISGRPSHYALVCLHFHLLCVIRQYSDWLKWLVNALVKHYLSDLLHVCSPHVLHSPSTITHSNHTPSQSSGHLSRSGFSSLVVNSVTS